MMMMVVPSIQSFLPLLHLLHQWWSLPVCPGHQFQLRHQRLCSLRGMAPSNPTTLGATRRPAGDGRMALAFGESKLREKKWQIQGFCSNKNGDIYHIYIYHIYIYISYTYIYIYHIHTYIYIYIHIYIYHIYISHIYISHIYIYISHTYIYIYIYITYIYIYHIYILYMYRYSLLLFV